MSSKAQVQLPAERARIPIRAMPLASIRDGRRSSHVSRSLLTQTGLSDIELAVIALLQDDGRRSYRRMAGELDTSEKNVRNTVRRLRESSVIEITAVTFPPLLGYRGMANVGVAVTPTHSLTGVANDLASLPVVDYLAVTTGKYSIFVDVVCRDRGQLLRCLEDDIRPLPGVAAVETFPYLSFPYQAIRGREPLMAPSSADRDAIHLSDVDHKIVAALAADGRAPYKDIAAGLGVSEAQVRQRVKRLTDAGALRIMAIANPSTLGFDTMAWVGICLSDTPISEVITMLAELRSSTWLAAVAGSYDLFVELMCVDEEELMEELDRIRASGVVRTLETFVYLDLQYKPMALL